MTSSGRSLLFGDIHNHNALGYGLGSLERSIDIAQTHLDFFAFTGHSSWHDMVPMEGGRERHWLEGFERLKKAWPRVQDLTASANRDGTFAAFLGFEWHSSRYGDQCVVMPHDRAPLVFPDNVADLRAYAIAQDGIMIPHHLGYATGHRGVNWDVFDPCCTPVVEVYSEHGNAEEDGGGYPYFNHSMGGRVTANTARAGLDRGFRFGFVASSDNHRGFPGAYGEGVMGVWAQSLSRDAIMDAIRARRTIALTGDRISADISINGADMGQSIQAGRAVEVDVAVEGRSELDWVDILVDGVRAERFTTTRRPRMAIVAGEEPSAANSSVFQVRFEFGWGPWGDLSLDRICDWDFEIGVQDGRLLRVFPCLQSGPFDEERRHRIESVGDHAVRVQSYTGRDGAYRGNPNQSIVFEVEGDAATVFSLAMHAPTSLTESVCAAELAGSSIAGFTGPFPAESFLWHRCDPAARTTLSRRTTIDLDPGNHYVYARIRQRNGQMAWTSPVFVEVGA